MEFCNTCIQRIALDVGETESAIRHEFYSVSYRLEVLFEDNCTHNNNSYCCPGYSSDWETAASSIGGVAFTNKELSIGYRIFYQFLSILDFYYPTIDLKKFLEARNIFPKKLICQCFKNENTKLVDGKIVCFFICRHESNCPVVGFNKNVFINARQNKEQLAFLANIIFLSSSDGDDRATTIASISFVPETFPALNADAHYVYKRLEYFRVCPTYPRLFDFIFRIMKRKNEMLLKNCSKYYSTNLSLIIFNRDFSKPDTNVQKLVFKS